MPGLGVYYSGLAEHFTRAVIFVSHYGIKARII